MNGAEQPLFSATAGAQPRIMRRRLMNGTAPASPRTAEGSSAAPQWTKRRECDGWTSAAALRRIALTNSVVGGDGAKKARTLPTTSATCDVSRPTITTDVKRAPSRDFLSQCETVLQMRAR